jgi:hypothetical protein
MLEPRATAGKDLDEMPLTMGFSANKSLNIRVF